MTVAVDAIKSAATQHHFLSVTKQGVAAIVRTKGNPDTHIILRGGADGPNYSAEHVKAARDQLTKAKVSTSIMIDCSHGNSNKDHNNQPIVNRDVAGQVAGGDRSIVGVMIESHINAGAQKVGPDGKAGLKYGVSITDACVDWQTTETMLEDLAQAVQKRRSA